MPPYTTHMTFEYYRTTAKKTSRIELISTVRSLHIGPFLLYTSHFSTGRRCRIVYRKKPRSITLGYRPIQIVSARLASCNRIRITPSRNS
jgi:hypothetical protein